MPLKNILLLWWRKQIAQSTPLAASPTFGRAGSPASKTPPRGLAGSAKRRLRRAIFSKKSQRSALCLLSFLFSDVCYGRIRRLFLNRKTESPLYLPFPFLFSFPLFLFLPFLRDYSCPSAIREPGIPDSALSIHLQCWTLCARCPPFEFVSFFSHHFAIFFRLSQFDLQCWTLPARCARTGPAGTTLLMLFCDTRARHSR